MKIIFYLLIFFCLNACKSSKGVHSNNLANDHIKMIKQDKLMKKKMTKLRKKCTPRKSKPSRKKKSNKFIK